MVMHKVDPHMESGGPPSQRIIEEMGKLVQDNLKSGVFLDGTGLHRSALRARVEFEGGKPTVTRGPYQGGNELVASFTMIEAESIDGAIDVAARIGKVLGDGEIEVGPVVEPWDLGLAEKPEGVPQRFLLMRKGDRAYEAGAAPPAALKKTLDELARDGVVLSTGALTPSATGARYRKTGGKRAWTDGPFTESKELVAGFSIIQVPTIEDARRWAERYADILGDNEVDVRGVAEA
ncbi:MAG TPA: YciI family protein [Kofleriaceae bacterium]|nr:YciI family protein [Kofleriaceae bacterium]